MMCHPCSLRALRALLSSLALLGGLLAAPRVAAAIPAFARKYGFDCSMCHASYPRLNDFGRRFRENGYRLPGLEDQERTVFEGPAPLAVRTSAGFDLIDLPGRDDDVRRFRLNGLDLLSAGVLAARLSYVLVYTPTLPDARGVAPQDADLELANVVASDILPGFRGVSLRVGRLEPADLAVSVKRRLSVAPYEIYDQSFPEGAPMSETQEGMELTGRFRRIEVAAGWVNGAASNRARDVPADLYARVSAVLGAGEGQTAGQRLGAFGYFGRARPLSGAARETFTRVGADASLNLAGWNLVLVAIWQRDDGALWQTASDQNTVGGFAELGYTPTPRVTGFLRWDLVHPDDRIGPDRARATVGGRYYLASDLALHLEYSHLELDELVPFGGTSLENAATARLDLAF